MKRILIIMALAVFLQCSHSEKDGPHWAYKGHGGPEHWGEIQSDFKTCSAGRSQSPIDLQPQAGRPTGRSDVIPQYQPGTMQTLNNGHTVQLNIKSNSNAFIAGQTYKLLQLHFHSPSEHTLNGKSYPLEVHLVHKNTAGNLAVVGVIFEEGAANPALEMLLQNFPTDAGKTVDLAQMFNPATLLPPTTGFLRYQGSLTTPPCSEGVLWSVARRTVTASRAQIEAFQTKFYSGNARPVQPMNGRILEIKQ